MPNKFAYLSRFTDRYIGYAVQEGFRIHDEDLLEAYEDINPPLVSGPKHRNIMAVLAGKRGRRFEMDCTIAELADEIELLNCEDLDELFLPALAARLRKVRGVKRGEGSEARCLKTLRRHRDSIIQSTYEEIMKKIDDREFVEVDVFGPVPVAADGTKSERALQAVHDLCNGRFPHVPAISTMRNIVSRG